MTPRTSHDRPRRGMSEAEVLDLPVSFPLEVSNRAIGLGRTAGYALAKRGEYPIPVLRLTNAYRCRRSDLLAFLGIENRVEVA
ncbi:hypothetical protein AB8A21_09700 [Streptomyces sp. BF23-18]|uniref:hypothetical protein n=1 Tax=Streptomyces sp. BF23-18 TaxID=3240282 RepID=UPI0034E507CB